MFHKQKDRQRIKNYLFATNVFLALILIGLFFVGVFVIRPKLIQQAANLKQYLTLDLNHLPQSLDTIEPDYVGKESKRYGMSDKVNSLPQERETVLKTINKSIPKIAILITNLGLNKRVNDIALTLPAEISFGILPFSSRINSFLHDVHAKGHEIYLYLPLYEGNNPRNLEKNFLITSLGYEENTARLNNILNIYDKYTGVYSTPREIFSEDLQAFQSLLEQIQNKNLIFVLGKANKLISQEQSSNTRNIIQTSIIIDFEADEKEIQKNLEKLIENAKNNNNALAYANGYTLTMEIIKKWLPTLNTKEIELVPVSDLLKEESM